MTEWFETPAIEPVGPPVEKPKPKAGYGSLTSEQLADWRRRKAERAQRMGRRRTRFKGGMSMQEVAARLNEASKAVSEATPKFLAPDVQVRTGLELNPLWQIECLVRGGVLGAKDQVNALRTLAEYTHSKAPSVQHQLVATAEDWLQQLATEEYPEVQVEKISILPHGESPDYLKNRLKRDHYKALKANAIDAQVIDVEQGSASASAEAAS